ncbi:uncharacterized protein [Panulirus ornatus]|uniref:uncharacterized protein n=1 Tax=Panulirus ornatus TaxID=150431 RepID=UPI003A86C05B
MINMMAADTSSSVNEKKRMGSSSKSGETMATPVILHSSLHRSSFTDYLGSGFKIKVSDATPRDSAILPSCGMAVLIVQMPRLPITATNQNTSTSTTTNHTHTTSRESKNNPSQTPAGNHHGGSAVGEPGQETLEQLIERVAAFQRGHRTSVLVLVGTVFGEEEVGGIIWKLQKSLLPRPPMILPAHGDAQAAAHLQILAKATVPEHRRVVEARKENILQKVVNRDHNLALGRVMGLNHSEISALLKAFGSLANVAKASAQEIHARTSINDKTAAFIVNFLNKDTVTV